MLITNNIKTHFISQTARNYPIFAGKSAYVKLKTPDSDIFVRNSTLDDFGIKKAIDVLEKDDDFSEYQGEQEVARKVRLFNGETQDYENLYITRYVYNPNEKNENTAFEIHTQEGTRMGVMRVGKSAKHIDIPQNASKEYKRGNYSEITFLYTNNSNESKTPYKALGRELIKQAMIESYKQGNKGRVALISGYNPNIKKHAKDFFLHMGFKRQDNVRMVFFYPEDKIVDFLNS